MTDGRASHTVAVIHSDEDVIETLLLLLEEEGYHAVGELLGNFKEDRVYFAAFCQQHQPQLIILDIPPPYEEHWAFFHLLKDSKAAEGRQFLLTTTNKRMLEELGGKTEEFEMIGRPFDLEELITAVKKPLHLHGESCKTGLCGYGSKMRPF
jgi:DNA-binding response OmpR family regulator